MFSEPPLPHAHTRACAYAACTRPRTTEEVLLLKGVMDQYLSPEKDSRCDYFLYMHLKGFNYTGQCFCFCDSMIHLLSKNNKTEFCRLRGMCKILDPCYNQDFTFSHQICFPNSTFLISRIVLCRMESNIPATVKMPPMIAQTFVMKCEKDFGTSVTITCIGEGSK